MRLAVEGEKRRFTFSLTRNPPPPSGVPETFDPPDAACAAVTGEGAVLAACSLWWSRRLQPGRHRAGLIGRFSSVDAGAGQALVARACIELAARGCSVALGPMDGSTWDNYRFVTERGAAPSFFLEPENPDGWPLQFLRAGFQPVAHYLSAVQTHLGYGGTRLARIERHMRDASIVTRCIDPRRFEEELESIHALAVCGFRDSPFFTPIAAAEFVARHRRLLPCLRPELVLVAQQRGRPVALFFAVPDIAQARRGERIDTAIVKTVVALPGRAFAGLSHVLAARAAAAARELGYRRAIHALMRESICSANWSARCAAPIRRYALFSKTLAGN